MRIVRLNVSNWIVSGGVGKHLEPAEPDSSPPPDEQMGEDIWGLREGKALHLGGGTVVSELFDWPPFAKSRPISSYPTMSELVVKSHKFWLRRNVRHYFSQTCPFLGILQVPLRPYPKKRQV